MFGQFYQKNRWFFIFLLIFILASTISASLTSESWKVPAGLGEYKVLRVIDGDTIEVTKIGRVRYIGIDTPETKHPQMEAQPYGKEASAANKRLVGGKKVRLEFDVQQKDKYGRYLAYVYVGTIFVNAYLVEAGYAQLMTIPPNVKYSVLFVKLQREARNARRGLWSLPAKKPPSKTNTNQKYIGNLNSMKFHFSYCKWAKKINPANRVTFKSRAEAVKAGYVPCQVCKP